MAVPARAASLVGVAEPQDAAKKPTLFDGIGDEALLSYGVPEDWLADVRAADEDALFDLVDHLPQEAAEALLDLAVGVTPAVALVADAEETGFAHPDARRRFRVLDNAEALRQALEYPWERWAVFLHPAQRALVGRRYSGPARVAGSAGTGKTVVALHRAAHLARQIPGARVLVTTFTAGLARALNLKLRRLLDQDPTALARIAAAHVDGIGYRLYDEAFGGKPNVASAAQVSSALEAAAKALDETRFTRRFLLTEWQTVVDAWQLESREAYRDIARLGRKTRVGGRQREALWAVFEKAREVLRARNRMSWAKIHGRVAAHFARRSAKPFTHVVADEAQDLSIAQLRLLAALVEEGDEALFFAGDLGQRIFQQPFSWLSLGIDVRGRSHSLRVNYRTSQEKMNCARVAGTCWVRNRASYHQMRRLETFDTSVVEGARNGLEAAACLYDHIAEHGFHTHDPRDLEALAVMLRIEEHLLHTVEPEYVIGFIQGAREAWEGIKDKI